MNLKYLHQKYFQKGLLILFCILLPLFILLLSYKIALYFAELTPNQENTFNFLLDKEQQSIESKELQYTEQEIAHLVDVKRLMETMNYIFYSLLLVLTLILTYCRKNKEQLIKLLKYGGITVIAVELMLFLLVLISFNSSFAAFHYLFFPQGNWIFSADSLLIQTFPLQFFVKISQTILFQAFLGGIIFILISLYLKNESVWN